MVSKKKKSGLSMLNISQQLDLLKSILESSTEYSIIALDLDANIVAWNAGATRIYKYEASEVINKQFDLILHPDDLEKGKLKSQLKEVREKGVWTGEMRLICKDGSQFDAFVTITLRKDGNNNPIGYTAISRDITTVQNALRLLNKIETSETLLRIKNAELEEATQQAQQASRLKSEFLANVSHELRTPLNGIIGFAELMYDGLVDPASPKYSEFLGDIISSAKHLLAIINDVLDLAKIEAGKIVFHPELVDLHELLKSVSDTFRPLIKAKSIQYEVQIDPMLGDIIIDPEKLKQIFYNYISNALKFTPKDGNVTVRIKPDIKNAFRLEVRDSGIGIRKEDINKLFVKFQQLEASATKEYPGTGLGLALTARIVEAQGGQVGVQSIFGKGSIFYAVLPCFPLPKTVAMNTQSSPLLSRDNIPKLLVVERASNERKLMVKALMQSGYEVMTASNATTARQYARKHHFDAIIMDLFLPGMNNWEIIRNFKANQSSAEDTPTIIATVMIEQPVSIGFRIQDFLIKPIKSEELFSAIKDVDIEPHTGKTVLIIDNDQQALTFASQVLTEYGFRVVSKTSKVSGLLALEQENPDVILIDPFMPGMEGFEFLRSYYQTGPGNIPIIIWTVTKLDEDQRMNLQSSIQQVLLQEDKVKKNILAGVEEFLPPIKSSE